MAYVRKTETLVNGIVNTVKAMRRKAIQPYDTTSMETGSPVYNALSSVVETVDWKQAPDLRDKMPSEWKAEVAKVFVIIKLHEGDFQQHLEPRDPYQLTPKHKNRGSYHAPNIKMGESDLPPIVKDWLTDRDVKEKTKMSLNEKYQTLEDKMRMFMEQHASLNAALKDMPDLELYVPDGFMAKIREPSQKRDKIATEARPVYESLGLDADEISALAIGHRVSMAAE